MAWIESHQALGRHPKTVRLAKLLKVRKNEAIGLLMQLWWWALDYAPEGVLSTADQGVVADACEWAGDPAKFWQGLIMAGFLDVDEDDVAIHDWMDYAGRLIDKRAANRARSKRAYDAQSTRRNGVVDAKSTGLPYQPYTTVPNLTVPDTSPLPPSAPSEGGCCPFGDATNGAQHSDYCPTLRAPQEQQAE